MSDIKKPKVLLDFDFYKHPKFRGLSHERGEKACYKVLILFGLMREFGGRLDSKTPGFWPALAKEIDVSVKVVQSFVQSLCRKETGEKYQFEGVYGLLDYDGQYFWAQQQLDDIQAYLERRKRQVEGGRKGGLATWAPESPPDSLPPSLPISPPSSLPLSVPQREGLAIYLLSLSNLKINKKEWNEKTAALPADERDRVWQLARENGHECVIHYLRKADLWISSKKVQGADVVATALTFLLNDKPTKSGFFAGGIAPSKAALRPERRKVTGGANV